MIAALFVHTGGTYFGLPNVDPWDVDRDARRYAGPWPVVAHPPCERWGRFAEGGPMKARRAERGFPALIRGDDGGCFAAALAAVRKWGGVVEHPKDSGAWRAFGLVAPAARGWTVADWQGGRTCQVEQGNYGHRAPKATWLYAVGVELPPMKWGPSGATHRITSGSFANAEERRAAKAAGRIKPRVSDRERWETPVEFRDVLIRMAESVTSQRIRETSWLKEVER